MTEQKREQLKHNLQSANQWMRILYMLLFWIILYVAMSVTGIVIFIQVLFALITGKDNKNLRTLGKSLATFINQILLFLTYNDHRKPFPFAAWGEVESVDIETTMTKTDSDVIDVEIVDDDKTKKSE